MRRPAPWTTNKSIMLRPVQPYSLRPVRTQEQEYSGVTPCKVPCKSIKHINWSNCKNTICIVYSSGDEVRVEIHLSILATAGCMRATPIGFLRMRDSVPSKQQSQSCRQRSSSLPDSLLWNMGESVCYTSRNLVSNMESNFIRNFYNNNMYMWKVLFDLCLQWLWFLNCTLFFSSLMVNYSVCLVRWCFNMLHHSPQHSIPTCSVETRLTCRFLSCKLTHENKYTVAKCSVQDNLYSPWIFIRRTVLIAFSIIKSPTTFIFFKTEYK